MNRIINKQKDKNDEFGMEYDLAMVYVTFLFCFCLLVLLLVFQNSLGNDLKNFFFFFENSPHNVYTLYTPVSN